jgi:pimeloyl-ACP methyl ester carboxylesterase
MPTSISSEPIRAPSSSSHSRYSHHFPSHLHPTYQNQLQHLNLSPGGASSFRRQPSQVKKPPVLSVCVKRTSFPRYSSKHSGHNHGPKWIHRHAPINGIIYHWVETTNFADDDDADLMSKPLVVFLHGFPQFWYCWRHQLVPLGEGGFRVVAPDLRGFNLTDKPASSKRKGASPNKDSSKEEEEVQPSSTYDMDTLTTDIRELIRFLGHDNAHIVGHDWGGIIAWAFAARFPTMITKLVVMNAPHLCRWRDVAMDYSSSSCFQHLWWTCWYTLCCQLLPSWIPESVLSYHRSWMLTHNMTAKPPPSILSCAPSTSLLDICATPNPSIDGFPAPPGGGGCAGCWKQTDMDLYRNAISQPGSIYALLEYYRNLWLSIQQMETYGRVRADLPVLVLWGKKDTTFPPETYAQGWENFVAQTKDDRTNCNTENIPSSVTVAYLDCGHFTPEEAPEEVNQRLLNFFKQPLPVQVAEI